MSASSLLPFSPSRVAAAARSPHPAPAPSRLAASLAPLTSSAVPLLSRTEVVTSLQTLLDTVNEAQAQHMGVVADASQWTTTSTMASILDSYRGDREVVLLVVSAATAVTGLAGFSRECVHVYLDMAARLLSTEVYLCDADVCAALLALTARCVRCVDVAGAFRAKGSAHGVVDGVDSACSADGAATSVTAAAVASAVRTLAPHGRSRTVVAAALRLLNVANDSGAVDLCASMSAPDCVQVVDAVLHHGQDAVEVAAHAVAFMSTVLEGERNPLIARAQRLVDFVLAFLQHPRTLHTLSAPQQADLLTAHARALHVLTRMLRAGRQLPTAGLRLHLVVHAALELLNRRWMPCAPAPAHPPSASPAQPGLEPELWSVSAGAGGWSQLGFAYLPGMRLRSGADAVRAMDEFFAAVRECQPVPEFVNGIWTAVSLAAAVLDRCTAVHAIAFSELIESALRTTTEQAADAASTVVAFATLLVTTLRADPGRVAETTPLRPRCEARDAIKSLARILHGYTNGAFANDGPRGGFPPALLEVCVAGVRIVADAVPVAAGGVDGAWHQKLFLRAGLVRLFHAWEASPHMPQLLELMATVTDAMLQTAAVAGRRHQLFPWGYVESLVRVLTREDFQAEHPRLHVRAMVLLARVMDVMQTAVRMTCKAAGTMATLALRALMDRPDASQRPVYACTATVTSSADVSADAAAAMLLVSVVTVARAQVPLNWPVVFEVAAEVAAACEGTCGAGCRQRAASIACGLEDPWRQWAATGAATKASSQFLPGKLKVTEEAAAAAAGQCRRWRAGGARRAWVTGVHGRGGARARVGAAAVAVAAAVAAPPSCGASCGASGDEGRPSSRRRLSSPSPAASVPHVDGDDEGVLAGLAALLEDPRMRERVGKPDGAQYRLFGEVAGYVTRFL
jgi:hypothetical protein